MNRATFYQIVHWRKDGALDYSTDYTDQRDFNEALAELDGQEITAAEWVDGIPRIVDADAIVDEYLAEVACERRDYAGLCQAPSPVNGRW